MVHLAQQPPDLLLVMLALGEIVEMAHHAEAAIRHPDALDAPVVGLHGGDVEPPLDRARGEIRHSGVQGVAEAADGLAGEGLGPDRPQHLGEVPLEQGLDVAEHLLRPQAHLGQAEVGVDNVDAKGVVLDQMIESVVAAAELVFGRPQRRRRPPLFRDLIADDIDADHGPAGVAEGVEVLDPGPPLARPRRRLALQRHIEQRLAALQHLPEQGLGLVGDPRQELADAAADVCLRRQAIDLRQAAVDAQPAQVAIEHAQADGGVLVDGLQLRGDMGGRWRL